MNETDFAGRLSSLMFLGVFRWTRLPTVRPGTRDFLPLYSTFPAWHHDGNADIGDKLDVLLFFEKMESILES